MKTDPPFSPQVAERLDAFAGSEAFKGISGHAVYLPGGIFGMDGTNTFYADIRALLASHDALAARLEAAEAVIAPFAKALKPNLRTTPSDWLKRVRHRVGIMDFERAAAFLTPQEPGE